MKNWTLSTVLISFLFLSCTTKNPKLVLVDSVGTMNHIMVVMDNNLWQGIEGDELKVAIKEDVYGLPQSEPLFNTSQVEIKNFGKIFRNFKSVLIVGIGEKSEFSIQKNVYAKPQTIIKLTEPNSEALLKTIKEKRAHMVQIFRRDDIKAVQQRLRKKQFDTEKLITLEKLGIEIQIPRGYKLVDDTGDFLWMRQYVQKGQTTNLLIYEQPINSMDDEEGRNILSARDSIGKKYIPGAKENTYMITEAAYSPQILLTELDGKKAFQTRGKWEVKDAFMAGPFLSYTIVDKPNNRLIIVEGFTYAPASRKRDYMFEIEAVLKTLKIKEATTASL